MREAPIPLLDLGEQRTQDSRLAGAKAATLARARRAGLPVLPGCVVPAQAGRGAFDRGAAALRSGGSGAARLAVMATELDPGLLAELATRVGRLGWPVVARSSSAREGGAQWAGAFSSFDRIGAGDLATALRGVWASAFSVDALERCAAIGVPVTDVGLAVLFQPEVAARYGGTARLGRDGTVEVLGAAGGPQGLLSGAARGARATVTATGERTGAAVEVLGGRVVDAVAALARRVGDVLDLDLIEWAWHDHGAVLLQAMRAAVADAEPAAPPPAPPAALHTPAALRVAALARRFPGPLGEELVLPWALGSPAAALAVDTTGAGPGSGSPGDALARAGALSAALIGQAWRRPAEVAAADAATLLRQIRGPRPERALARIADLAPVDEGAAHALLTLLDGVATAAVSAGLVPARDEVWQHPPAHLSRILAGQAVPPGVRVGPDRWEPFLYTVVCAAGRFVTGTPAAPGVGTGAVRVVRDVHQRVARRGREVVVAARPVPALASLLWTAAGVVTGGGDPGAHLFEVATSLGVPAVVDVDLDELLDRAPDTGDDGRETILAVDGTRGHVWSLRI